MQAALRREWSIGTVLPELGAAAAGVDEKFAGVRNMGRLILATDYSKPYVPDQLTDQNSAYWRGVMELFSNWIVNLSAAKQQASALGVSLAVVDVKPACWPGFASLSTEPKATSAMTGCVHGLILKTSPNDRRENHVGLLSATKVPMVAQARH